MGLFRKSKTPQVIRKGECNNCGYCCVVISRVKMDFSSMNDQPFFAARDIPTDGIKWFDVVDECKHHVDDSCNIHSTRPQTCRDFPTNPEDIRDSPCSYWFEDEDGNRV